MCPQLERLILNAALALLCYKDLQFNPQVRWLLRLFMVSQNLLCVFSLFSEKLKISEGYPVGNVNIFHSNLKSQLRFRDYLEIDGNRWALWAGSEESSCTANMCSRWQNQWSQSRQFHTSLLSQVCCFLLSGMDSVQLSDEPFIFLRPMHAYIYLCFCLYCIVLLLGMVLHVYPQILPIFKVSPQKA